MTLLRLIRKPAEAIGRPGKDDGKNYRIKKKRRRRARAQNTPSGNAKKKLPPVDVQLL